MKYEKETGPKGGSPKKQLAPLATVNFDLGSLRSPETLSSPYNWLSEVVLDVDPECRSSSGSDQSIHPGFLTPVKTKAKRSRPASGTPASPNRLETAPGVENIDPDTPLINRLASTLKKQRSQAPRSISSLLDRLSRFEYSRAYPRIRYRVQLEENFGTHLAQLIDHDYYNGVNNVLLKDRPKSVADELARMIHSDLPSYEKIQKTADGLSRLFGLSPAEMVDPLQVASVHPRQHRPQASFKKFVADFRSEILVLRDDVLSAGFRFVPRILNISVEEIVRPFFRQLDSLSGEDSQVAFSQRPEYLEALLLAGLGSPEVEAFCLLEGMLDYWAALTADIHPDVAQFLIANYCDKENHIITPKSYPFYLACAMYEFQCDLTKIAFRLIDVLEYRLSDFTYKNLSEALCVLWDPSFNTKEMKDRDFKAIYYLSGKGDVYQFLAGDHSPSSVAAKTQATEDQQMTADVLSEGQSRPRQSFLPDIQKKSFAELMETLFHSYGRLVMDFYDFVNFYNLAKAQQFVFSALSKLESIEESPLVQSYRCGLDDLDRAGQELSQMYTYYYEISDAFVNELHRFNSVPSVHWVLDDFHRFFREFFDPEHKIEPYPYANDNRRFDEDWLVELLTKMSFGDNNDSDDETLSKLTQLLSHFRNELDKVFNACEQFCATNQKRQDQLLKLSGTRAVSDQLITTSLPVLCCRMEKLSKKSVNLQVSLGGGCSVDSMGHETRTKGLIDRLDEVIEKIEGQRADLGLCMSP